MRHLNSLRSLVPVILLTIVFLRKTPAAELHVPSAHPTIQDAVTAAGSGDTIRIAPGDYYEQIIIPGLTNLTLEGAPGVVLHATEGMEQTLLPHNGRAYTIIGVVRGAAVTFRGLEFQGHRLRDFYDRALSAIVFRGSSGRIENCVFQGFRAAGNTPTRAINVENDLRDGTGISNIGIFTSRFFDNKTSIFCFGAVSAPGLLRTIFTLEGNTIVGAQPSEEVLSNGVAIDTGAQVVIKGNTITGHNSGFGVVANDSGFAERGSFYPLKQIVLSGNILSNNAVHLAGTQANNSVITNNVFARKAHGARPCGVTLTGTNIVIADNNFGDMEIGIDLPAGELLEDISRGQARNITIANNWFKNVTTPVQKNDRVTALIESGTATCCFQSKFLSIAHRPIDGSIACQVRASHSEAIVLEASSNLRDWTPVLTSTLPLPISELEKSVPNSPGQFYRLRAP